MEKDVLYDSADTNTRLAERKSDHVLQELSAPTQTQTTDRRWKRPHTKKNRVLKITLVAVLPICCIAIAISVLLAVEYISRKSENYQVSNASEFAVVKEEPLMSNSSRPNTTLVVSPFITSENPPWSDCGSKLGKVLAVHSEQCPLLAQRCQLPVGANGLMEIMFQMTPAASVPVDALGVTVCGSPRYLSALCVEAKPKEANPCENSNLQCPLQPGEKYVYRMLGGLKKEDLPAVLIFNMDAYMYIRLTDLATKQLVVCVKIPVTIIV